jgi:cytochrome c-type biogenesis protein CcmH
MTMRTILALAFFLLTSVLVNFAQAKEAAPLSDDPVVETRLMAISEELRCLVCQNETLAASRAELADDLRKEVRRLIKENKTDQEIKDYLVSRYGDFVLYRPPVKPTTWLLWFGPFLLLAGGVAALITFLRRRGQLTAALPLSNEDKNRADLILKEKDPK